MIEMHAQAPFASGRPLRCKKMPLLPQTLGIKPTKSVFIKTEFIVYLPELFHGFYYMTIDLLAVS